MTYGPTRSWRMASPPQCRCVQPQGAHTLVSIHVCRVHVLPRAVIRVLIARRVGEQALQRRALLQQADTRPVPLHMRQIAARHRQRSHERSGQATSAEEVLYTPSRGVRVRFGLGQRLGLSPSLTLTLTLALTLTQSWFQV